MGSALIDFLITLIGLVFIGAIIFMAIDFISTDDRFKKIGKFAATSARKWGDSERAALFAELSSRTPKGTLVIPRAKHPADAGPNARVWIPPLVIGASTAESRSRAMKSNAVLGWLLLAMLVMAIGGLAAQIIFGHHVWP